MYVDCLLVERNYDFLRAIELQTLTLGSRTELSDVVESEHHVLRRHGDRCSVGRIQDIVGAEHKKLSLHNRSISERKVDCHLVTVEVGVECRTSERMELDSLTLNHLRLECLNTESVKCRCTVEKNRMTFHHVLKNIPNHRVFPVDNLLCGLDGLHDAALNQFPDDERFVKLGCHKFRQTALVHLELRSNDDDRTC